MSNHHFLVQTRFLSFTDLSFQFQFTFKAQNAVQVRKNLFEAEIFPTKFHEKRRSAEKSIRTEQTAYRSLQPLRKAKLKETQVHQHSGQFK